MPSSDAHLQTDFPFPKSKRIVDEDLLSIVRTLPCLACNQRPSDAHHVTSRGSGGHDIATNVMPLCRGHHTQWHAQGPGHMVRTYPAIKHWLELAGRQDVLSKSRR